MLLESLSSFIQLGSCLRAKSNCIVDAKPFSPVDKDHVCRLEPSLDTDAAGKKNLFDGVERRDGAIDLQNGTLLHLFERKRIRNGEEFNPLCGGKGTKATGRKMRI
jgi:hypothetical protein